MTQIALIAPGLLLKASDVQRISDAGIPILAIANVFNLAPRAAYCYAADGRWWDHNLPKVVQANFNGDLVTCEAYTAGQHMGLFTWVEHIQHSGNELPPAGKVSGTSSGEHALIFAVHQGFKDILLLGYEYGAAGNGHYFGDHPPGVAAPSDWRTMARDMGLTAGRCANAGVKVVNCTEVTALNCFRRGDLQQELDRMTNRPTKTRRSAQKEAVVSPASASN